MIPLSPIFATDLVSVLLDVRAPRKRILSGPVHTDGVWVRLVEDERGRRLVEVLGRGDWTSSTRDLSHFALDVPLTLPHG